MDKVLFVDDERHILDAFRNNLRKRFAVTTAQGPEAGLQALETEGPFATVVSDLKMPGMDGVAFLSRAREISPDTTRIMLTGHAGMDASIQAVNQGQVFRFLTKPCPMPDLLAALEAGVRQYRLITAERELLHGTLRGTIKLLTEALGLANPLAFGKSQRIKALVGRLSKVMTMKSTLELELAAMLSHIGCMGLPQQILEKVETGKKLTAQESSLYREHPRLGAMLIQHIPRLGGVAEIVAAQQDDYSHKIPHGARVLRLALDYDALESRGSAPNEILFVLRERKGAYDPDILDAMEKAACTSDEYIRRCIPMRHFKKGMVLAQHVMTVDNTILLATGTELNDASILRLQEVSKSFSIHEPICVLIPLDESQGSGLL